MQNVNFLIQRTGPKFKFGVQVPRNTKEAYLLDRKNGDTLWQEAIAKELKQIDDYETFQVLDDAVPDPVGYQQIPYHVIFDVKFDLRRKARLVAGGIIRPLPKRMFTLGLLA